MRNLLIKLSYQGRAYHGFQVQQNAMSIAEVIQNCLEKVLGKREQIIGCSRTDAGVHANCFYFNMHTTHPIPEAQLVKAMNHVLPKEIAVRSCEVVSHLFHARYDCKKKHYRYHIWNAPIKNPFFAGLVLHYPYPIDVELLNQSAQDLVGTHDFKAFSDVGGKLMLDTVRTIDNCQVWKQQQNVYVDVIGNGFLYHMVRIIVGTLLEINEKKINPQSIPEIIALKDRSIAGRTVKAEGLYLHHVEYAEG